MCLYVIESTVKEENSPIFSVQVAIAELRESIDLHWEPECVALCVSVCCHTPFSPNWVSIATSLLGLFICKPHIFFACQFRESAPKMH